MHYLLRDKITLSASVSCLNLYDMKYDLNEIGRSKVKMLHFDVVDGIFNDCFILGMPTLEAIRPHTDLPIEVHLGVTQPFRYIERFIDLGADYLAIHYEVVKKRGIKRIFKSIRDMGGIPILALKADTVPQYEMLDIIELVPWVLKLTVNPGYSGQKIIKSSIKHIEILRNMIGHHKLNIGIEADGNINNLTIPEVVLAGADILTGGSSGLFVDNLTIPEAGNNMLKVANEVLINKLRKG